MPTYVLPQTLVFQELSVVPAAVANPLRSHISGGHAQLIRYSEDDERDSGLLGYYDRLTDTPYDWPERPAGGTVDQSYTKLWMKNALLQYFQDTIGAGSTITKVSGYNNRIRSATVSFADNPDDPDTYPKSAVMLDRGVKAGDIVKVRGIRGDSTSVTLWTYVRELIGDTVDSTIDAASSDDANQATSSDSATIEQIAGDENCVTLTGDASAYDGLTGGYVEDTYDIIVTEGSVNGDFTTATLRIISGSGEDDVAAINPEASGDPTDIGTRGLTVTFATDSGASCSASAETDGVSPDDLIVGQRWRVTVVGTFTEPSPTSAGDYTGTENTTYIATVSRGGLYTADALPQITVSTTNGVDIAGPVDVEGAGSGNAIDIGNYGVTMYFSGTGLRKGDRYYIEVTGAAPGPMRNIVLGHNIDSEIASGSEVDLTLYILQPLLQISAERAGFAPLLNWETSSTEITVNDGIVAYDPTWTDSGVQEPLDVYSESTKGYGQLFVETRYWLCDLGDEVGTIQDIGDINTAISGSLHPDNPLKWGVFKALENAGGAEVKYTAVCDPSDDDSWVDVLNKLVGRDDAYGLVPLTRRRTVLDLYAAHIAAQSAPEEALWRVLWVNLEGLPQVPLVSDGSDVPGYTAATTTDDAVALAVIEDDPLTSGTQYTLLRCTSDNANFITNGVRAGDVVRTTYTSDGFGNETYSEYVIDAVHSEDELLLLTGPDTAVSVAAKVEVWRNLTATEEAAAVAVNAGAWGSRRVRAVWPDTIESSGTIQEGYHLCAALAGLVSGVLPHQGLTNLEITGFTNVSRTTTKFNRSQLDAMALGGAWIVSQSLVSSAADVGSIYTRHAVTTGSYDDINQREEMITRNLDSISYRFKDWFAPFIGVTNVTNVTKDRIGLEVGKLIRLLQTEANTTSLGGQLIDATLVEFREHATLKDRYVLKLDCQIPYALNNIEIHLAI